ncbi:MAG: VOC family protein [Kiritimatiellae bacterium]|nr:VOC family protein [Kiritimatiellia bacterium]
MQIHHACAICSSEQSADRFYEGVLGLKKMKTGVLDPDLTDRLFGTACRCGVVLYANEDMAVEILLPAVPQPASTPFSHVCITVDDRNAFLSRCEAAGVSIKRVPKGDSLVVFVQDYDGNTFEVKEEA